MPSTSSTRIRFEQQAAGENLNTWGAPKLNAALSRLEEAKDGRYGATLTGPVTLTSVNYTADQARMAFLDFTSGLGGLVTVPAVEKTYYVRNGTSGAVVITTGSGVTASIAAGDVVPVAIDGTNCYAVTQKDFGGSKLTSIGTPTVATDAANKGYVDGVAMAAVLPNQAGNGGAAITTDGATASWSFTLGAMTFTASGTSPTNLTVQNTTARVTGNSAGIALQPSPAGGQAFLRGYDDGSPTKTGVQLVVANPGGARIAVQGDNFGGVTFPNSPAFAVHVHTTIANVTGDGTAYFVLFDTTEFDVRSNYAAGTGKFTVTSPGTYEFNTTITLDGLGASHSTFRLNIVKNGVTAWGREIKPTFDANTRQSGSLNALIPMVATDYVQVQITVGGSTKTVNAFGDANGFQCTFSGRMVC